MSHELHYTSATRGLRPGTHGFCTVAATSQLAAPVAERLEGLSGYRPAFPPGHPSAGLNPSVISHLKLSLLGRSFHVLSRVGEAGLDYSGRGNKYAHHVAIEGTERPAGGPAWLALRPGFLDTAWSGEPRVLPQGRATPQGDQAPGVCRGWARRFGDAGWAGAVAELFLAEPNRPVYFVFDPGEDLLPLFAESIALLPRDRRWDVSFSTYFTGQAQGLTCLWRGVVRDSPEAEQARRLPGVLILDPSTRPGIAPGGPLVEQARTGVAPARPIEAATRPAATRPTLASPPEPAETPKEPRSYSLDPTFAGSAPVATPAPRPGRPARSADRLDKAQVATWVGVVASLVFLVGAATAWYRSRPEPVATASNPVPTRPPTGVPVPVAVAVEDETSSTRPTPPRLKSTPRPPRPVEGPIAVPTPSPEVPPPPVEPKVELREPEDARRLSKVDVGTLPSPPSPPPEPRPAGSPVLNIWDIQLADTLTLGRPPVEIELLAIPPDAGRERLTSKKDKARKTEVVLQYRVEVETKDLATFSCSPEGKVVWKRVEMSEKWDDLFGLIGNHILKVGFEQGDPEYYLLQKPFKLPRTIVLARHFGDDLNKPRAIQLILKDQRGVDLPRIDFGTCTLRPVDGGQPISFRADPASQSARVARVPGPPESWITLEINPEAQDKRGELTLDFDAWSPEEWRWFLQNWRDRPIASNADFLDESSRRIKRLIPEQRKTVKYWQGVNDGIELEIDNLTLTMRETKRAYKDEALQSLKQAKLSLTKPKDNLKYSKQSLVNLEGIDRALAVIGSYKLELSLFVACEGGEGRRFQLPLEGDETPLPARPRRDPAPPTPSEPRPSGGIFQPRP